MILISNNERAREAMWFACLGTIHSRTTAMSGSKIIEAAFRKRDRQNLSFLDRIASERCKDLMHRWVSSTLICLKMVTHKRALLPINP